MIWALFIQSPWSQLCDFCSQQEHFLESFLCKLDRVTNEVFLLIAPLCKLKDEKQEQWFGFCKLVFLFSKSTVCFEVELLDY